MMTATTIAELLEMAIAAEKAARDVYLVLARKFAHDAEAARFWKEYAEEEAGHMRWLESQREAIKPEQLSVLADRRIVEYANKVLSFPVEAALTKIQTFEDAYQLANELEHAETNVIFEFLLDNFAADLKTQTFLRVQLREHVGKLVSLPGRLRESTARQSLRTQE